MRQHGLYVLRLSASALACISHAKPGRRLRPAGAGATSMTPADGATLSTAAPCRHLLAPVLAHQLVTQNANHLTGCHPLCRPATRVGRTQTPAQHPTQHRGRPDLPAGPLSLAPLQHPCSWPLSRRPGRRPRQQGRRMLVRVLLLLGRRQMAMGRQDCNRLGGDGISGGCAVQQQWAQRGAQRPGGRRPRGLAGN